MPPVVKRSKKVSAVYSFQPYVTLSCTNYLLSLAGVRGPITCFVTTIKGATATYHVYELDVTMLENTWLEKDERSREWVDYAEALRRLAWKPELAQALTMSSLAPRR